MRQTPLLGYRRPADHLVRGHYYSLDDVCSRCHKTLGEHAGGSVAFCPTRDFWENMMRLSNPWQQDSTFEMHPERVRLPEGV